MPRYGMVIDLERCMGCRACMEACKVENATPEDAYYLDWDDPDVKTVTGGAVPPYDNPDLDQPHGDRGTLVAGGGHYDGTTEKCTFCVHRLEKGSLPACVANCPVDVFSFGDLDDPESAPAKALRSKRAFRLKEELNTSPKVFYIGQPPPGEEIRPIDVVSSTGGQ